RLAARRAVALRLLPVLHAGHVDDSRQADLPLYPPAAAVRPIPVRVAASIVEDAAVDVFWRVTANTSPLTLRPTRGICRGFNRTSTGLNGLSGNRWHRRSNRPSRTRRSGRQGSRSDGKRVMRREKRWVMRDRRELLGLRFDCLALRREPLTL